MTAASPTAPQDTTTPARDAGLALPWDARAILGLFTGWIVLTQVRSLFQLWPGVSVWYPPAALLAAACLIWG